MKSHENAPTRIVPGARSLQPSPTEIATRAYDIWRKAGQPDGHALDHWLLAESQIRQERRGSRVTF